MVVLGDSSNVFLIYRIRSARAFAAAQRESGPQAIRVLRLGSVAYSRSHCSVIALPPLVFVFPRSLAVFTRFRGAGVPAMMPTRPPGALSPPDSVSLRRGRVKSIATIRSAGFNKVQEVRSGVGVNLESTRHKYPVC